MVAAAERALGVTLPPEYLQLMRTCNGGYTRNAACPSPRPTGWAPDHVPVDVIFGIPSPGDASRFKTGLGILVTGYMTAEWGLPQGLVLLSGNGHSWIALDYRRSGPDGPPAVAWLDGERNEDLRLADSFEDFLRHLVPADQFRSELE
jgi:hypothetical protein